MSLSFYSPADVIVVIGGVLHLSGYMNGTFLEISKEIPPYRTKRTPDGTTARIYVKDNNYSVRFTLAQSSDSNNMLMKIAQLDELEQTAMFPLLIKDRQGSSLFFSPTAWIQNIPNQSFGNSIEARVWEIQATGCVNNIGGNESTDNLYDDLVKTVLSSAPYLGQALGEIF